MSKSLRDRVEQAYHEALVREMVARERFMMAVASFLGQGQVAV